MKLISEEVGRTYYPDEARAMVEWLSANGQSGYYRVVHRECLEKYCFRETYAVYRIIDEAPLPGHEFFGKFQRKKHD